VKTKENGALCLMAGNRCIVRSLWTVYRLLAVVAIKDREQRQQQSVRISTSHV